MDCYMLCVMYKDEKDTPSTNAILVQIKSYLTSTVKGRHARCIVRIHLKEVPVLDQYMREFSNFTQHHHIYLAKLCFVNKKRCCECFFDVCFDLLNHKNLSQWLSCSLLTVSN